MDGIQTRLTHSLQVRLSAALALAILAAALVAGALSFWFAYQDAIELQDDLLQQSATLVDRQALPAIDATAPIPGAEIDAEDRIVVQTLQRADGSRPQDAQSLASLPQQLADGFHTVASDGDSWRVYVKSLRDGARIAIAQRTQLRGEVARDSAVRTVVPLLVLVPVLLLLMSALVRRMFRPLGVMAADMDGRGVDQLHHLDEGRAPSEVRPFVVAINRLLERVGHSVALQRRFVADAAHELRSPLTALSLNAQRLQAADMSAPAREQLAVLRGSIARARDLQEQLLSLVRAQERAAPAAGGVSLRAALRTVLEDLVPLADARHVDLGVLGEADAMVQADMLDLTTLIRNLVDNAVRYTPAGGCVDIALLPAPGAIVLQVDDTGAGIEPAQRERVFDPFYRVAGNDATGSGLGLSIVRAVAERLGAEVALSETGPDASAGLRVRVRIPLMPTTGAAR